MHRLLPLLPLVALAACGRRAAAPGTDPDVSITQFYAAPVSVDPGQKSRLCYGVENAKTVVLDPPIERLWPSVARCFEVDPEQHGVFTLTASDALGRSVARTVHLTVGPPRATIITIGLERQAVRAGERVVFCFRAKNAASVEAGPGRWLTKFSPFEGCLADYPRVDTTYRVRVTDPFGKSDSEQVTVRVRQ